FLHLAGRQRQPLSLAILTLDHSKQMSDQHGHAMGDDVLHRLGELLQWSFRSEDVVARWGGDEIIVGMYGMSRDGGVRRLAAVLEALRQEEVASADGAGFHFTFRS